MTTEIDYQVLRDVSERAITAMTHLSILPGDDDLLSEKKLKELGIDIDAIHAFKIMAGPETVLSLLDERDALNERIAELEANLAKLAEDHQKAIESIKQADAAVKLAHEKFSALVAENAGLKHAMDVTLEHVSVTDAGQAGVAAMIINDALHHSETPATDAFLAEGRTEARKEGAYFVANRMLAVWKAGFIDDTAKNAADIARMILTSTEFMANAPESHFDRSFSDGVLEDIAEQLRKGVIQ
ncbi:ead/Ea22-like family protein [Escherichia coli]|nr:ead/Ea22-like family protein [Escherichia coli]HDQ6618832.1 ead/Ea22-like family protein [Escherichia coli O128:H2]HDQ6941893.1 ead/Ea22-like family protein [Escherichia coli O38:H26]EEC8807947.1 ead/Ea22-like family protein [Escherichia coli]EEQ8889600.1 ead/Ea22-like family protein [Escherichia coli]